MDNSAAGAAGIKVGDIITRVNDMEVNSSPELQGMVARYRPGEKVTLTVNRQGKEKVIDVILNNRQGNTALAAKEKSEAVNLLGAELETVDGALAKKLDIKGGVKVNKLFAGKLRKDTDAREGFIITKVDGDEVSSVKELEKKLENKKGGVMLEGVYEDVPGEYYYAFGM